MNEPKHDSGGTQPQTEPPPDDHAPRASVGIQSLTFSDGTVIRLTAGDVVVLVGPNNSGKSQALKDIQSYLEKRSTTIVVKHLPISFAGTKDDVFDDLRRAAHKVWHERDIQHFQFMDTRYNEQIVNVAYRDITTKGYLGLLHKIYVSYIDTVNRLVAVRPVSGFDARNTSPANTLQIVYVDAALERRLDEVFRIAFNQRLSVDHFGGAKISLRVSDTKPYDRRYIDLLRYRDWLATDTVDLYDQGDGFRAFVGVILQMMTGKGQIILLDEPEAFLHPPQARLLGRLLIDLKPANTQLFVATHSTDVLKGLLSETPVVGTPDQQGTAVRFVRLRRSGSVNQAAELSPEAARRVWRDPLLRYSEVLEGLFHPAAVACEADADCRFYQAVSDASSNSGKTFAREVLFISAGGKSRFAVVVNALRSIGVPVNVIADADILQDDDQLRQVLEALGADWNNVSADYKIFASQVNAQRTKLRTSSVKAMIQSILENVSEHEFPHRAGREIREAVSEKSPWRVIKKMGKHAVPHGEAAQAYQRIYEKCRDSGLHICPVGELESFCISEGGKGSEWLARVLEKYDLEKDPALKDAREFVDQVFDTLARALAE